MTTPMGAHLATCAMATALLAGPACVESPAAQNPWSGWTTLRLKAKAAPLLRGRVELRVSDEPGERRLETSTSASFFGATIARSETTTLLDPVTGRTKEYTSYSKKRGRRYVFHERSYVVEKMKPAKGEDGSRSWEVIATHEYANPEADGGGGPLALFDYYGMLLHLRRLELHALGDEVTLYVATSAGPQAYRIVVSEARSTERAFTDLRTEQTRTLHAREFRLTISPADPDAAGGFLNMEGETEVWVEAETKTPLEIVGKIPKVPGKVKLVLSAMG